MFRGQLTIFYNLLFRVRYPDKTINGGTLILVQGFARQQRLSITLEVKIMDGIPDANELTETVFAMLTAHSPSLLGALVTLIVGWWMVGMVTRGIGAALSKGGMEDTLKNFLMSLTGAGFKAIVLITVAGMIGIETTSFIAVLGAAGLAVGLALQGSLANFAGGVLILIFRPYKVGDFIQGGGETGTVRSIEIFNTVMTTADNKKIIVPNAAISNATITNFSAMDTRRVDIVFGVGYGDDLRHAKSVLEEIIRKDERILVDPEPQIVVSALGDSAVDITTRSWVKAADYWGVFFDLTEEVKLSFDEQGISIPYPQQDLHLFREDNA